MSHNSDNYNNVDDNVCSSLSTYIAIFLGHTYVFIVYREEYYSMKKQWKSFSEVQLQRFRLFGEHRDEISEHVINYILMNILIQHCLIKPSLKV